VSSERQTIAIEAPISPPPPGTTQGDLFAICGLRLVQVAMAMRDGELSADAGVQALALIASLLEGASRHLILDGKRLPAPPMELIDYTHNELAKLSKTIPDWI